MDFNILNCSGDELALLIILIAMKISKKVNIDDLNALAGIFSALAGLIFLEAKQKQRYQQNQEKKKNCVDNTTDVYYCCQNVKRKYRKKDSKN